MSLDEIPLGRLERTIVDCLSRNMGKWVQTETILAAAYGNRPDGGPNGAEAVIRVTVSHLRKKLSKYGYVIEGYAHAGRRLIREGCDGGTTEQRSS